MVELSHCRACGGEAVPSALVEGLCARCRAPLEAVADRTTMSAAAIKAHQIGERVGPYRILQQVGAGGMGVVYRAEQEHPVRRQVALKLIKVGMDTKEVVARFESERQALALMNHPAIAKVFDAGATDQGRPYFAMEYVEGVPITEYCDRQRLGIGERLELFTQVCEGVQHAHHKGVIHRDLKPSNVLVRVAEGKPTPKIIDFGVAKAITQRLTDKTLHTQLGQIVGTPEYMSPEQAEMTALDIDTRTDVYSLGVMLYELLVGARPFESSELRGGSYQELRRKIREEEPARPSSRLATLAGEASQIAASQRRTDVKTLRRQLRGDLDWIVVKAIEKDRTRRYGSAAELAADVGRHLRDEPVVAGPPSTAYRMGKFVRRHRTGVVAAGLAVAAVLAGSVLATVGMVRAVRAERAAREQAATAEQVSEFLVGLFEVSDPMESRGATITARELLDKGAERIERELADQPLVRARLMDTMGRVYGSLDLKDRAVPLLEGALDLRRRLLGERHPDVAASLLHLGTRASVEESLALRMEILGPDHIDTARSRYRLGNMLIFSGDNERGRALLEQARHVFEREMGPDSQAVSWCLNDLGASHVFGGEYSLAKAYFERALEIKQRLLGPDHPDVGIALNALGVTLMYLAAYDDALPLLERAVWVHEASLGPEHRELANTLESLGELQLRMRKLNDARSTLERALKIVTQKLPPDALLRGETLHTLAQVERASGDLVKAEGLYRQALPIFEKTVPGNLETVQTLEGLAGLLRETGRAAEAEPLETQARTIREKLPQAGSQ